MPKLDYGFCKKKRIADLLIRRFGISRKYSNTIDSSGHNLAVINLLANEGFQYLNLSILQMKADIFTLV